MKKELERKENKVRDLQKNYAKNCERNHRSKYKKNCWNYGKTNTGLVDFHTEAGFAVNGL